MGSSYRLVNGVLWCISRKPRFHGAVEYCQIATLQIEYIRMCLKVVKRMLLPISCQQSDRQTVELCMKLWDFH